MKLYYSQGSCSLASHIIMEEAGLKFDATRLDLSKGEQKKPEFLAVNEKAKVPTVVLDSGTVLTENPAIMSYIADITPQAKLLAPPGDVQRAKAQEWLAWCASTVHPSFGPLFHAGMNKPSDEAVANVQANLDRFDKWLTGKQFVLGDTFSIADAYTLVFYNWARKFKLNIGPHWLASVKALLARPGVQRALHTQGLKVEA